MKKRRELDALVSKNLTSRPSKITKNGNHELLRNDSYSSETEEYTLPDKDVMPIKKPKANYCLTCLLLFSMVMLVSCFGIIASLLWMFVQLKNEMQDMKIQLGNVDAKTLDLQFKPMQLKLNELEYGDHGLIKMTSAVVSIQDQLTALKNFTVNLKLSSTTALSLVDQMKELSQTVADVGSSLKTLEKEMMDVKDFKSKNNEAITNLQDRIKSMQLALPQTLSSSATTTAPKKDQLDYNQKDITPIIQNVTSMVFGNYSKMFARKLKELEDAMKTTKNLTGLMNSRISFLEIKPPDLTRDDVSDIFSLKLSNETLLDSLILKERAKIDERIKAIEESISDTSQSEKKQLQNISGRVRALNSTCASLADRVMSLETKLILLAEQEHHLQLMSTEAATSAKHIAADSSKVSTTRDVYEDKDGKGAPSEIAATTTPLDLDHVTSSHSTSHDSEGGDVHDHSLPSYPN